MKPASRGVAIVAVVAIITGLAACSDNAVKSPAVPSTAPTAQPSPSPSVVAPSPSAATPSPSVALASPSVASTPVPTANPAKVVTGRAYRPVIDPAGFTSRFQPISPARAGHGLDVQGWQRAGGDRGHGRHEVDHGCHDRGRSRPGASTNGTLIEDTRGLVRPGCRRATSGTSARTPPSARTASRSPPDGRLDGGGRWRATGRRDAGRRRTVDDHYRQEYLAGEAEDQARVLRHRRRA